MPYLEYSDSGANKEHNPWLRSQQDPQNHQIGDSESSDSDIDEQLEDASVNSDSLSRWSLYAKAHPFSGNEQLLIGAQTDPRLVWSPCGCSTHAFKH